MLDLSRLITQPEGQYFDRKSLYEGPADRKKTRSRREVRDQIAKYVAAFANAEGGTLILGVEDDGTVTGHGYPSDEVDAMLAVPTQRLSPPQAAGYRQAWQGKELLVFEAANAERAVMVHGDGFPRRVHDQVIQESEEVINAIKQRARSESIELDSAPGLGLGDLDPDLIKRAQAGAGLSHQSVEDYLVRRRLADYRGSDLVLRKGAVLLFARQPHDIDHPNAGVRIFQVRGTERQTGTRRNVRDLPRIEGALPLVIEQTYAELQRLIGGATKLHDLFFKETSQYPTFAWQEAIVNAVAHRDYRIQGQGIEVWLYDDRLEIHSPGALLPEVDLARLQRGESLHFSRNPRITRVLSELAIMREQGEGIPRMFDEMEQAWLQLPELSVEGNRFVVVLRNHPILEASDPQWAQYVRSLRISLRQQRALVAFAGRSFTNGDYQSINRIDRDQAYRELKDLVSLGLLKAPEKSGTGARYEVILPSHLEMGPPDPRVVLGRRMQQRGYIQAGDYRDVFHVERNRATRALSRLVAEQILVREGAGKGVRYRPGPRWAEWAMAAQFPP